MEVDNSRRSHRKRHGGGMDRADTDPDMGMVVGNRADRYRDDNLRFEQYSAFRTALSSFFLTAIARPPHFARDPYPLHRAGSG